MHRKRTLAYVVESSDDKDSVEVCRLDTFDIPHIDLIKIHVEGFETRVIRGAMGLISQFRPMIMFERKKFWQTRYNDQEGPDLDATDPTMRSVLGVGFTGCVRL